MLTGSFGLQYCLNFPTLDRALIGNCSGYNSNGYVYGLVGLIGGQVNQISFRLDGGIFLNAPYLLVPGSQKPVSSSEF